MLKLLSALLVVAACQADEKSNAKAEVVARSDTAYASDIRKLCDSIKLSGAEEYPKPERALPLANWLAANLETPESRQFLVKIQPLVGEPKAQALEAEAKRMGLDGCALASEWR